MLRRPAGKSLRSRFPGRFRPGIQSAQHFLRPGAATLHRARLQSGIENPEVSTLAERMIANDYCALIMHASGAIQDGALQGCQLEQPAATGSPLDHLFRAQVIVMGNNVRAMTGLVRGERQRYVHGRIALPGPAVMKPRRADMAVDADATRREEMRLDPQFVLFPWRCCCPWTASDIGTAPQPHHVSGANRFGNLPIPDTGRFEACGSGYQPGANGRRAGRQGPH